VYLAEEYMKITLLLHVNREYVQDPEIVRNHLRCVATHLKHNDK
jgi:hypothetical protein